MEEERLVSRQYVVGVVTFTGGAPQNVTHADQMIDQILFLRFGQSKGRTVARRRWSGS
jgi:hypothetical protein